MNTDSFHHFMTSLGDENYFISAMVIGSLAFVLYLRFSKLKPFKKRVLHASGYAALIGAIFPIAISATYGLLVFLGFVIAVVCCLQA